jgi:NAD(P)-dependent dehydrogenase (short-subunit alcohol dehydrogenase family)
MNQFLHKVAIVTGGSDGIGKALVEILLNAGASVVTCGRHIEKFDFLKKHYEEHTFHVERADVSVEADCKQLIEAAVSRFGKIDILINNAGISMRAEVLETQTETLKKVMDINFWGSVYCTKYALPHLLKTKGVIAGISSIAGYRGLPGRSGYSASKFALQGWLESLRTELLHTGVHVMWVSPGFTASSIRQHALNANTQPQGETPLHEASLMPAPECAGHILEAVGQRKRTLILTFEGKRTVWMNKWFPSLTDKLVHQFFYQKGKLIK